VTLLRVVERDQSATPALEYLAGVRKSLEADGIPADVKTDWGKPAEEILWLGKPSRYDLIAMTSHGRSGWRRVFMGSVAESVLRHAEIPLLINRPTARTGDWKRIVVGLDGSPLAEQVLPDAARMAKLFGASVHLVKVGMSAVLAGMAGEGGAYMPPEDPMPYLLPVCERLAREGAPAVPVAREGSAAFEISRYAEEVGAGLVMITTHGRTGLARAFWGSVAEDVLRSAPCPVFVRRTVRVAAPAEAVAAAGG
jgi:nucleotide-binding universal stress UspA family protein